LTDERIVSASIKHHQPKVLCAFNGGKYLIERYCFKLQIAVRRKFGINWD
jgi:hypothetical protein